MSVCNIYMLYKQIYTYTYIYTYGFLNMLKDYILQVIESVKVYFNFFIGYQPP